MPNSNKSNKINKKSNTKPKQLVPFGAELKYRDLGLTVTTVPNAETATLPTYYQAVTLCNLIRGDENENREGAKVLAHSLEIRGQVIIDKNSSGAWNTVVNSDHVFRVIIYQDKQCNGALAPISSVFELTNLTGNDYNVGCYPNRDYISRFRVLSDTTHTIKAAATTWDGTNFHYPGTIGYFSAKLKLGLAPLYYTNNSDTVADLTSNNYGMFIMLSTSSTSQRKVTWRSRFQFYDY